MNIPKIILRNMTHYQALCLLPLLFLAGCVSKNNPIFATANDEVVFAAEFYDRFKARFFQDRPLRIGRDPTMSKEFVEFTDRYISLMDRNDMTLREPSVLIETRSRLVSRLRDRNEYQITVMVTDNRSFRYEGRPILLAQTGNVTCAPMTGTLWFTCNEFMFRGVARTLLLRM